MKKIVYITLIMVFFMSCNEKLDIVPRDFVNTDGLFSNDPAVLSGAVNAIFNEWYDRGRNVEYYGLFENVGTDLGTYDEYRYEEKPYTEMFCYYDNRLNPEAYPMERIWGFEYKIVNLAARIIQAGQNDAIIDDPVAINTVAEAKFFWSLAYYELFMTFGNVPLLIEPVDGARDDFERTPVEEIIPEIEKYLLEAIEVLDENTSNARVSKNACRMLLAKVYLAAAGDVYQDPGNVADSQSPYWVKAENIAEDIIESGTFQLITEKKGPHAEDQDTVPGPINWDLAGFPNMREGLQQSYMVRHPNYFSCLFQNDFEGPEQGNTETIFRIAINGQDDLYGRNYIRMIWMPYVSRANGITRDFYQGGRTWGRVKMTDFMCFDIWDYKDVERGENYDLRKHGSYKYRYFFNDEGALKDHFLYVRTFANPDIAVDSLYGWRALAGGGKTSRAGVAGTITKNDQINWGDEGGDLYTADYVVVELDSVFVQPIITNYAGNQGNSKWGIPYYEEWFSKRVYYMGDTIWGPRPGDEFFPRSQIDWQSAAVGCTKHSYWVRNSSGLAESKAENETFLNSSGGPGDISLFRYAEAFLIAGEAEFHQGKLQEAADHFNVVRKRAFNNGNVPVKWEIEPNEISIDWILDERGRELFTESYRWFTIKRLKAWDRVLEHNILAKENFEYEKHRMRPIPLAEIQLNKGNKTGMYQNFGYN